MYAEKGHMQKEWFRNNAKYMLSQSSIKSSTHFAPAESLGSPVLLGQASAMCAAYHGGKGCCPYCLH